MEDSFKIYTRYLQHKQNSQEKFEPDVTISLDEQFTETTRSIRKHKSSVRKRLLFLAKELQKRAESHDNSKLDYPELGWLVEMDREGKVPYGSEAYFEKMKRWECFFKHHYENNTHHPDHYTAEGTHGMTIVDVVEMMCDVISYCDDLPSTKAFEIISDQAKRFGLSEELSSILKNTVVRYFSWIHDIAPEFDAKQIRY